MDEGLALALRVARFVWMWILAPLGAWTVALIVWHDWTSARGSRAVASGARRLRNEPRPDERPSQRRPGDTHVS